MSALLSLKIILPLFYNHFDFGETVTGKTYKNVSEKGYCEFFSRRASHTKTKIPQLSHL